MYYPAVILMILDEPGSGILGNDATTLQQTDQHEFGSLKYDERVFDLELQETALAAYEQAIQLAPRAAILHYHKGQVLKQLGRHAEAQQAYAEARSLGYYG